MPLLLLASASPARLATLRAAGISPLVKVSTVDEDAVLADARARFGDLDPADAVLALAQAKALDVSSSLHLAGSSDESSADALDVEAIDFTSADVLLACDSMLEFDGAVLGKPHTPAVARDRWRAMRGKAGVLHTGHWVVDLRDLNAGGSGGTFGATASTTVEFADLTDAEIDAYIATGEPLKVAGGFTVDGLGGAFVTAISGDFHNVVGVSLPLLRELLAELGFSWTDLWGTETATS